MYKLLVAAITAVGVLYWLRRAWKREVPLPRTDKTPIAPPGENDDRRRSVAPSAAASNNHREQPELRPSEVEPTRSGTLSQVPTIADVGHDRERKEPQREVPISEVSLETDGAPLNNEAVATEAVQIHPMVSEPEVAAPVPKTEIPHAALDQKAENTQFHKSLPVAENNTPLNPPTLLVTDVPIPQLDRFVPHSDEESGATVTTPEPAPDPTSAGPKSDFDQPPMVSVEASPQLPEKDLPQLEDLEDGVDRGERKTAAIVPHSDIVVAPESASANPISNIEAAPASQLEPSFQEGMASEGVDTQDELSSESIGQDSSQKVRARRQYRPSARVPTKRGLPPPAANGGSRDRALPIEVRLVLEHGGFCRLSLLPRRGDSSPEEIVVSDSEESAELIPLQEDWYEDVVLPNLGSLLRSGIEWTGSGKDGALFRWSLAGREIYVLGPHDDLYGFVSTPRLILGERHVVLCVAERREEVLRALACAGSPDPSILDVTSGIPQGWLGFANVIPQKPVDQSQSGDILDALRPLPDIEIVLEGGIRFDRSAWLIGYPPTIRVHGDRSSLRLLIDGHEATPQADGIYVAPHWDEPGEHIVWTVSESRSYEIRAGLEEWSFWDAYQHSLGDFTSANHLTGPSICGCAVRLPITAGNQRHVLMLPGANIVVLGAEPGQIEFCSIRRDQNYPIAVAFPEFEPIWAVPADVLHCDKRFHRVLLIGPPTPPRQGEGELPRHAASSPSRRDRLAARQLQSWCQAILDTGRKGLPTDPDSAAAIWRMYGREAKRIWRRIR